MDQDIVNAISILQKLYDTVELESHEQYALGYVIRLLKEKEGVLDNGY